MHYADIPQEDLLPEYLKLSKNDINGKNNLEKILTEGLNEDFYYEINEFTNINSKQLFEVKILLKKFKFNYEKLPKLNDDKDDVARIILGFNYGKNNYVNNATTWDKTNLINNFNNDHITGEPELDKRLTEKAKLFCDEDIAKIYEVWSNLYNRRITAINTFIDKYIEGISLELNIEENKEEIVIKLAELLQINKDQNKYKNKDNYLPLEQIKKEFNNTGVTDLEFMLCLDKAGIIKIKDFVLQTMADKHNIGNPVVKREILLAINEAKLGEIYTYELTYEQAKTYRYIYISKIELINDKKKVIYKKPLHKLIIGYDTDILFDKLNTNALLNKAVKYVDVNLGAKKIKKKIESMHFNATLFKLFFKVFDDEIKLILKTPNVNKEKSIEIDRAFVESIAAKKQKNDKDNKNNKTARMKEKP